MKNLRLLVARNLSLFLKNKVNILLSTLSIIIVMSLYFVFLRDFVLDTVKRYGIDGVDRSLFADRLMVAGLLIVVTTTTCFGIIQIAVRDKESGIAKDYLVAPTTPMQVAAGYWIAAAIIASCFTILTFLAFEWYFWYRYSAELTAWQAMKSIGLIVLSSLVNSGFLLVVSFFIRTTADYSTFANLYGTIIGFLAGAYLPYFFYGGVVKNVLFYLPCTQLTSLIREVSLRDEISYLHNELMRQEITELKQTFGITLYKGSGTMPANRQLAMVILWLAVILLASRILAGWKKNI